MDTKIRAIIYLKSDGVSIISGSAFLAPISIVKYSESALGNLNTKVLNSFTKILEPTLGLVINTVLDTGFDIN